MVMSKIKRKILHFIRVLLDSLAYLIGLRYSTKQHYLPKITDQILFQPAIVLANKIRKGELKSQDVIRAYIDRIKSIQPEINAVVQENFANAIQEAIEIDKRVEEELARGQVKHGVSITSLPFIGVPFTTKDSIGVKGIQQTSGLYHRKGIIAQYDSVSVSNMKKAGAIFIALTNVPELVMWWDSYNVIFGKTNNPYDKSRIVGGSSGGEAALITAAGSVIGIGSDIGGSIRMPCYFCGIFGHKTTPQIVSTKGHYPVATPRREKLLSCGPMCRYAADLKPMLKVLAGDNINRLKLDEKVDLKKIKVYYMEEIDNPLLSPVDADIVNAMKRVIKYFEGNSNPVKKVYFKQFKWAFELWLSAMTDNSAPKITQELTNRTFDINPWIEFVKSVFGLSKHTMCAILTCFSQYFAPKETSKQYQKLEKIRQDTTEELHKLLGDDGILLFPTHPQTAPKHNGTFLKLLNISYTQLFNTLFVAITQVPLGLSKDGLPIGLQVVAAPYNDHISIAVAEALEKEFGGWVMPQ